QARAELGYVDFLRGRYDRAELRLTEALKFGGESPSIAAKATTYLGSVESDRGNYAHALDLLHRAVALSRTASDPRREAFARSMVGRIHLFRDALDDAAAQLDAAIH